ncbi:MAG: HAD-IA family hydrolase, partial [Candidatus Latescibacteria bacterium]|nr:HAD-IA family hydrolase [Candidatus Latescibacterota bacterium]
DHFDIIHAPMDLLGFFEFVLAREDYDKSKPHPDAYLKAMQLHGWTPDDCVVVEDSERGCAAAAAAGLRVLIVPNDLSAQGDFSPAYKVLGNVREVADVVAELQNEK